MMQTGIASNDGATLCWSRWAGGDVQLLLINGLGSPQVTYEQGFIDELLSRGFDVVRFDNRDVGQSSRHPGETYLLSDMAADAVAVLDAVGFDRAVVWGMSMGGMIAQQLTIDFPERVSHLVSMMSSPDGDAELDPDLVTAMMEPPPTDREGWLAYRLRTEQLWGSPKWHDSDWQREKAEEIWDAGVDPAATERQFAAIRSSPGRSAALGEVTVPAMVIHGECDTLLPPVLGQQTAAAIAGSTLVIVEGMGHDLPPDQWPVLASLVAEFVQR